jgi:hypothetical protein
MRMIKLTILARDLDAALSAWKQASGLSGPLVESDEGRTAALAAGDISIEVVEPAPASDVAGQMERRGEGMFSLAVEVDNLQETVSDLRAQGVSVSEVEVGKEGQRQAMIEPASSHGVPISLREKGS